MFDKFKAFYNKDGFDYEIGQVDPHEFNTIFFYILKSFQVFDDEHVPFMKYIFKGFLVLCALTGLAMSIFSTYHGIDIQDLPLLTEAGVYFILFLNELLILWCSKTNLPQYHALIRAVREDFNYACLDGAKYRKRFFEHQLDTWKVSIVCVLFVSALGAGSVVLSTATLLFFLATHNPDNLEEKRPLLFPVWLPSIDFGDTPNYEIAFVIFNVVPCAFAYCYVFKLLLEIIWVREIMLKGDIVIWNIQDLMVDIQPAWTASEERRNANILQRRLREIIIKHNAMFELTVNYAKVYKKILLFTQELYASVACFTAYSVAEKLDDGELNAILLMLCISSVILTGIPYYLSSILASKITSVCDACWDTPFWHAGPSVRVYLVLLMQHSLRPLPTRATGFKEISLETFSQKTMTAYSYFNMLRQVK